MSHQRDQGRSPIQRPQNADVCCRVTPPTPEQARVDYALARADEHALRERYFLELAVRAPDDDSARTLELHAFEAFQDALAITQEHDIDE
jgi:hypothetical protein